MDYRRIRIIRCSVLLFSLVLLASSLWLIKEKKELSFSKESGFYDEPFYLEIYGFDEIHFTLDATEPTVDSPMYVEPILISDTSEAENIYSAMYEVYLGFNPELATMGLVNPRGDPRKIPTESVDKATIVKAASFDREGNIVATKEAVFFVGFSEKEEYEGINIISISTNPDNLFGYENGIYVIGKEFDNYFNSLSRIKDFSIGHAMANYRARGKSFRKPAQVYFFNSDRQIVSEGEYLIAIQGGTTRADIPRSLNIYEADNGVIDGKALGFDFDVKSVNLFSGGNDRYTKIKDAIINERVQDLNVCTRTYIPYELFLEGEYWGTYFISEKYDEAFFNGKYGVKSQDVVMIKRGSSEYAEIGDDDDRNEWLDVKEYITCNDMYLDSNYDHVKELIDIDSCVNYFAIEIYIANTDWPYINVSVWKSKNSSGKTRYDDGKWRWVLYDVNCAMDLSNIEMDGIKKACQDDAMFRSLMDNPEFAQQVKDKLVFLAKNTFEPETMRKTIMKYHDKMLWAMKNDYSRFFEGKKVVDYTAECNKIFSFFEQRAIYIISKYEKGQ